MDRQMHDDRAFKQTTHKDHLEKVFPKGRPGPVLGAPKQYESPRQSSARFYDGDRPNPNGQISDGDEQTNKVVY